MARTLNVPAAGLGRPGEPEADPVALSAELIEATLRQRGEVTDHTGELAARLARVDPAAIRGDDARVAFWINVYNALLLRITAEHPFRGSVLLGVRSFGAYAFDVGGRAYSLNLIEHGILRGNRRPPGGLRSPLRDRDPRLAALPTAPDPRIHFALNCGARSCPPIRVFEAGSSDELLESATRAYLEGETDVDAEAAKVELPGLMKLYGSDFGGTGARLAFAAERLPALAALLAAGARPAVGYAKFDWRVAAPAGPPSGDQRGADR